MTLSPIMLLSCTMAVAVVLSSTTQAFVPHPAVQQGRQLQQLQRNANNARSPVAFIAGGTSALFLQDSTFDFTPSYDDEDDEDDEDDDDDDDDDEIDPDSLGDWRTFRRNLAADPASEKENEEATTAAAPREERPNEKVLQSQSEELALEYSKGVWAHCTSTVCTCSNIIHLSC
jgi:hypothetical protein